MTSIGIRLMNARARRTLSNTSSKLGPILTLPALGTLARSFMGKVRKEVLRMTCGSKKEFAHDKPNVKIPSLRGNVEWHMLSGASIKDLIEQCETMYAKRFGGDQSMYGHYDIVIVQAYGNEMFPNKDQGDKLFKLSAVPKDFDDDLKKLVEVLSKLSIRSFIMFGGSATLFQIEGPWKEFVDQKVDKEVVDSNLVDGWRPDQGDTTEQDSERDGSNFIHHKRTASTGSGVLGLILINYSNLLIHWRGG